MSDDRGSKKGAKSIYHALDFYMLRAPALSVAEFEQLANLLTGPYAENFRYSELDFKVQVALAIGSPSLHNRLHSTGKLDVSSQEAQKLLRYLKRMSRRATPFGAFAGIAIGKWGQRTDIALTGGRYGRARMDTEWVATYVRDLEAFPLVRKSMRWFIASEAILSAGCVRVPSVIPPLNGIANRAAANIALTPMLTEIWALAQKPVLYSELCDELVGKSASKNRRAVERFLNTLWSHGVLVTDLMPPVTCVDSLEWLQRRLAVVPQALTARHQLSALAEMLDECAALGAVDYIQRIGMVRAYAGNMCPAATKVDIQIDMALELSGESIVGQVREDVARAAQTLLRISPMPFGPGYLHNYKVLFHERYGANREIPLNDLVDGDKGLGLGRQLSSSTSMISPERLVLRRETLSAIAFGAIREKRRTVDLDEKVLANLELASFDELELPPSLELNVTIVAGSSAMIDEGNYLVVVGHNVGAPSAGQHFGRFSDITGQSVLDVLANVASFASPFEDTIVSELVYMPVNLHYANVSIRRPICSFETPFGVTPSVAEEFIVRPSELMISLRRNEFFVRWVAQDKRVRFRSGHMLNPQNAPPVMQFLNEIGRDGIAQLSGFDWGELSSFEFLPQVRFGKIILSLARWRLTRAVVGLKTLSDASSFRDFFNVWRAQWDMPEQVSLTHGDNLLPIDVGDVRSIEEVRKELLKSPEGVCILHEQLPTSPGAWLPSQNCGLHHSEVVVPMILRSGETRSADRPSYAWPSRANDGVQLPGGAWVFVKLYCARPDQDGLLANEMHSFIQSLYRRFGQILWFFVRYADPTSHIRLRIKVPLECRYESIFRQVADWSEALVSNGKLSRVAFDTYEQELHRYGGEKGMEKAEEIFCVDSNLILEIIRGAPIEEREGIITYCVDDILRSFGLSDFEIVSWLRDHAVSRRQAGTEYRKQGKTLRVALLEATGVTDSQRSLMAARRVALLAAKSVLDDSALTSRFFLPSREMLRSFVHMHCNRAGLDSDMENRLISILARTRESILAMARGNTARLHASDVSDNA